MAEGLKGADIAAVIMNDPPILLMDLEYGVRGKGSQGITIHCSIATEMQRQRSVHCASFVRKSNIRLQMACPPL